MGVWRLCARRRDVYKRQGGGGAYGERPRVAPAPAVLRQRDDLFSQLKDIKPENPSEHYLLANLERVISAVEALPEPDRLEIIDLLQKITRGQESDILRFPDPAEIRALETCLLYTSRCV